MSIEPGQAGNWVAETLMGRGAEFGPKVVVTSDGSKIHSDGYWRVFFVAGELDVYADEHLKEGVASPAQVGP